MNDSIKPVIVFFSFFQFQIVEDESTNLVCEFGNKSQDVAILFAEVLAFHLCNWLVYYPKD